MNIQKILKEMFSAACRFCEFATLEAATYGIRTLSHMISWKMLDKIRTANSDNTSSNCFLQFLQGTAWPTTFTRPNITHFEEKNSRPDF